MPFSVFLIDAELCEFSIFRTNMTRDQRDQCLPLHIYSADRTCGGHLDFYGASINRNSQNDHTVVACAPLCSFEDLHCYCDESTRCLIPVDHDATRIFTAEEQFDADSKESQNDGWFWSGVPVGDFTRYEWTSCSGSMMDAIRTGIDEWECNFTSSHAKAVCHECMIDAPKDWCAPVPRGGWNNLRDFFNLLQGGSNLGLQGCIEHQCWYQTLCDQIIAKRPSNFIRSSTLETRELVAARFEPRRRSK